MRATQPVCSIRVSRRLAKRSDARQEIVFPQKKYFLQLRINRSTRIQEGQTNQPDARNLCAASHDTSRCRYLYLCSTRVDRKLGRLFQVKKRAMLNSKFRYVEAV